MAPPSPPRLTVVLLTWNEERNIDACLASLAKQREKAFEVLVIDAASSDATAAKVAQAAFDFPVPLRLHVAERRLGFGEARNLGVAMSTAPFVAFLSADAEADPHWVAEALHSLRSADLVYGRQIHAPRLLTVGTAVRGLRYHFPAGPTADPARYASNVNAAFRRDVLEAYPFNPQAPAAEDLLLAQKALAVGYHAAYNPDLVVRHHDVESAQHEWRKNVREGEAWGLYADQLGLHLGMLGWGAVLGFAALLLALSPGLETFLLFVGVLYAPTLRRAWRRRRAMGPRFLAVGVGASPAFDLAFLAAYLRGLLRRRAQPVDAPPGELRA